MQTSHRENGVCLSVLFTPSTRLPEQSRPKVKERTLEILIIVLIGLSFNATKKTIYSFRPWLSDFADMVPFFRFYLRFVERQFLLFYLQEWSTFSFQGRELFC